MWGFASELPDYEFRGQGCNIVGVAFVSYLLNVGFQAQEVQGLSGY